MTAQISGDAKAGRSADSRTYLLNCSHERKGEQHGPANAETELRSGLTVCADTGRVVVRRPGNEAGSERAKEFKQTGRWRTFRF
jgi:hypothetical protein